MTAIKTVSSAQNKIHHPGDRDFFQTREGMFFCVTGDLHPPGRITAYLKYSPATEGKWHSGEHAYRRELDYYHVRNVSKTLDFLSQKHPDYVTDCPVRGIRFSLIPKDCVDRYFDPRHGLAVILAGPRDPLEQEVCDLVNELTDAAHIPSGSFGLTGSILIGLHNQKWSDIDLLVYGKKSSTAIRSFLNRDNSPEIQKADTQQREQWAKRVSERFHLSLDTARHFSLRRWNYGFFQNRYFSIHPVKTASEISEQYGDHIYRCAGTAKIRAVISRTDESFFLPATYGVQQVQRLDGSLEGEKIKEIVTHEGLFCDIVDAGQYVEASGKVETVDGNPYRLVIGSAGQDGMEYLKPI